jgi:hypothetical protein
MQYLTDRRDGKAKQPIEVKGGLIRAHTAYRDPKLVALSQEERSGTPRIPWPEQSSKK